MIDYQDYEKWKTEILQLNREVQKKRQELDEMEQTLNMNIKAFENTFGQSNDIPRPDNNYLYKVPQNEPKQNKTWMIVLIFIVLAVCYFLLPFFR